MNCKVTTWTSEVMLKICVNYIYKQSWDIFISERVVCSLAIKLTYNQFLTYFCFFCQFQKQNYIYYTWKANWKPKNVHKLSSQNERFQLNPNPLPSIVRLKKSNFNTHSLGKNVKRFFALHYSRFGLQPATWKISISLIENEPRRGQQTEKKNAQALL